MYTWLAAQPYKLLGAMNITTNFEDEKNVPVVRSLAELIAELHKVFAHDKVNVEYVKALLNAYKSEPNDWKEYAKFDDFRYTRNLVDSGNGKFNLMALCWGEGHGSSIHDHSSADCFVKILDGQLKETMFDWPTPEAQAGGQAMTIKATNICEKDAATYINDSMGLHRVENPSHSDKAVSLHLYCPPFESCMMFDQRTGHRRPAKVTFWSKYGQRTPFGADEANECSEVRDASKTHREIVSA